ncbi:MAG: helix-turn-helix transcriptional regulator [Clostridiales bacterium]|nr:helix-turn-helix transcriptional regulator [Clostridiales bacterium]
MINEKEITKNLKYEIEHCGKTKKQIAEEVKISAPTLSQYLSGRILPSVPTFAILCEVIGCSSDEVLGLKKI